MNHTIKEIKETLEIINLKKPALSIIDFSNIPEEEVRIFLEASKNNLEFIKKLDISALRIDKNELQKWQILYIKLHDLYHKEFREEDLNKLEIKTTASLFPDAEKVLDELGIEKLILAYISLGFSALKINRSSCYLISEKVLLGEFASLGGFERGIWGIKVNHKILPIVIRNVLDKLERGRHEMLVNKYKNFTFDFL